MPNKTGPDRRPWMSDAGYESAKRAEDLAPAIAETATCTLAIKCPHCGRLAPFSFSASVGTGSDAESSHLCEGCEGEFYTYAAMDVSVEKG